ncbi:MAG TPA: VOC family protein [Acidimicrobiia bacterium]|nr:VOC family protein [Acidimicrobiia bacterium]
MIIGLGQLHVSVSDIDRAVAWYRDVLGLNFLFQVPGQPMAFFDCGGVRLYLGKPENDQFRSRPIMYFAVDDIDAEVEEIEGRGGEFSDRPHVVHRDEGSELWLAALSDPEGLPVVLMETRRISASTPAS